MSVAEKLKAKGRMKVISEGISKGLRVGKIQSLQEFRGQPVSSCQDLQILEPANLENRHADLHHGSEARFKR